MTEKGIIDIEETGLRNRLVQIKGQRKVILLGDFSQYRPTGPLVEAWASPATEAC